MNKERDIQGGNGGGEWERVGSRIFKNILESFG
jgi:hypothetical protein